jgi:hypothetical protein
VANATLGARWTRDHADQKKPALAAALEQAFDPAANTACIGLDHATRDSAAAWVPPGLAYVDGVGDGDDAEPEIEAGTQTDGDSGDDIPRDAELAASDLPAFLTDNGPDHVGRNEASVT